MTSKRRSENAAAAGSNPLARFGETNRRSFLQACAGAAAAGVHGPRAWASDARAELNLARVAVPTGMRVTSENKIAALNDGAVPASSRDREKGLYALRPDWGEVGTAPQWVQYSWSRPVTVGRVEVYWAIAAPRPKAIPGSESSRIGAPRAYRILYWNGEDFVPVEHAQGLGTAPDCFNATTFRPVTSDKLRLEVTTDGEQAAGVLEWRVFNAGAVPGLPPLVDAGVDRSVVMGGTTYLAGKTAFLREGADNPARWSKLSGPGAVRFASATAPVTTATFTEPGDYILQLAAGDESGRQDARLRVHAEPAPPPERLNVVYTRRYAVDSPLWSARAKTLIVDWIPHCIAQCERTDITPGKGDGGLDNFIEAAKSNRGEAHGPHKGYVFSNAWVHQTVESMCIALMVDAQGDREILAAQAHMQATLDRWIPIILAAQMPDGYLQTAYTLADRHDWPERWSPEHRGNHEGYVSGYFIESAINHYTLTDGKDLRLYNGAKRLADCWAANIGPGKKPWFDGHQEMEQALVRFGRFVNDQEGAGRGDAYIALAKFLLDSRRGGSEYDQSHLPPGQQYEAVGHAVRAMYFYSGMADIAAETRDPDYQSAVLSLWDNMVNRKYYITGGIGSGETSEGFGPNYSLRNEAYCESCSSCGVVFFQYKLNLAYHDAKYADLYEQTMYNALLGGVALDGRSFCYTNPLVNTERTLWHVCPCCVGNIPRTLLMLPTWSYVKSRDALYVNLFVGSRVHVGEIAGTPVEVVQKTDYPWGGRVSITLNPGQPRAFALHVRIPDRHTSALYTESPIVRGLTGLRVNGEVVHARIKKGYAVIRRQWHHGDRVDLDLPIINKKITADKRIRADLGEIALKYGPLVYNVETADQADIDKELSEAPLRAVWRPDLLGGVMVLEGKWKDGSPMTAIPNYARMNRVGPPTAYLGDPEINCAPGAAAGKGKTPAQVGDTTAPALPVTVKPHAGAAATAGGGPEKRGGSAVSKVWI